MCIKDGCESNIIMNVSAKTSDMFNASIGNLDYDGYVPTDIGIGGSDYIQFSYCLECGQIQGEFPVKPDFEDEDWQRGEEDETW